MQELVIANVDDGVFQGLQDRATRHGRTPAAEAKAILAAALSRHFPDDWGPVDAIYQRLAASGQMFSDSAELIREDRDR